MSASKDAASPNKSAGGTSGSSWDTPLKSRVSPDSSRPFTSPQTPVEASSSLPADLRARIGRAELEGDRNKTVADAYVSIFGSSEYRSQRQAAREPSDWVEGYSAEAFEEVSKFTTDEEVHQYISDTLTELEADLARETAMRESLRKVFALLNDA